MNLEEYLRKNKGIRDPYLEKRIDRSIDSWIKAKEKEIKQESIEEKLDRKLLKNNIFL